MKEMKRREKKSKVEGEKEDTKVEVKVVELQSKIQSNLRMRKSDEREKRATDQEEAERHLIVPLSFSPAMPSFRDVCSPLLLWKPALVAVEL